MIKLGIRLAVMLTALASCLDGLTVPAQADGAGQPPAVTQPHNVDPVVASTSATTAAVTGGATSIEPSPTISLGGCGFLQNCLYFSQRDQRALLAGGAAGVAAVICIVGSPAVCAVAAIVTAVAISYLGHNGICSSSRRLRVRWFPTIGGATCVA